MLHANSSSDFYSLLRIPRDASSNDVKMAYRRTLLRLHPDKQSRPRDCDSLASNRYADLTRSRPSPPPVVSIDIALLKEAYKTLSDENLRAAYDGLLRREDDEHTRSCGPRPAQVVSLEEFTMETVTETGPRTGMLGVTGVEEWWYGCRCGGMYRLTQHDLENGTHLVGCEGCSEVIWVGYEEVAISDDEEEEVG